MKLNRESRFLILLGSIVLVGAIGLGVLLMGARSKYAAVSAEYDQQAAELKRLQSLAPYPDQENLDATRAQIDAYAAAVSGLLQQFSKLNFPTPELSPNQFQDRLREVVSALSARAAEKGVALPPGFYLGFDPYQDSLPRPAATAALGRQLSGLELLASTLIDARVGNITVFGREPIPEEKLASAAAQGAAAGSPKEGAAPLPPLVAHQPVNITFTCEPGQLRVVANELLRGRQFFIVRSLRIQNLQPKGPPRNIGDILAASGGENAEERKLEFIVGKEKLEVALRVELVNFGPADLVARAAGHEPAAAKPTP